MGSFSVGGNAGFAIGPLVAGFCAYTFDIHGLCIWALVNFTLAFILYHNMPKVLSMAEAADEEQHQAHPEEVADNDWPAFGKLSFVIFARSIGFALCNTSMGVVITFVGGILADKLGFIKTLRVSFCIMVPSMFLLFNSTNVVWATVFLVPVAFSLFAPYSPMVILGQTYLGKNVGFASGVTLGLTTTIGGLVSPMVGWGADMWGLVPALQILWIAAAIGAVFTFLVPVPKAWRNKPNKA